jgi:hypothetical protein
MHCCKYKDALCNKTQPTDRVPVIDMHRLAGGEAPTAEVEAEWELELSAELKYTLV